MEDVHGELRSWSNSRSFVFWCTQRGGWVKKKRIKPPPLAVKKEKNNSIWGLQCAWVRKKERLQPVSPVYQRIINWEVRVKRPEFATAAEESWDSLLLTAVDATGLLSPLSWRSYVCECVRAQWLWATFVAKWINWLLKMYADCFCWGLALFTRFLVALVTIEFREHSFYTFFKWALFWFFEIWISEAYL